MSNRFQKTPLQQSLSRAMLCAVMLAPVAAFAAEATIPVYVGASAGVKNSFKFSSAGSLPRDDEAKTAGKIYAGYIFNQDNSGRQAVTHAVEVSAYTGKTNDITFKRGNTNTYAPGNGEMLGVGVAYAASYEVAPQFSLTGRVGVGHTRSDVNFVTGPKQSTSDTSMTLGLGVAYHLNQNWSLHADWDRLPVKFDTQKDKLNILSVGARYKF
jgi:outer membrane immunogenic protein